MTVSSAIQARLDKIEADLNEHNLRVEKRYGFYPVLISSSEKQQQRQRETSAHAKGNGVRLFVDCLLFSFRSLYTNT